MLSMCGVTNDHVNGNQLPFWDAPEPEYSPDLISQAMTLASIPM